MSTKEAKSGTADVARINIPSLTDSITSGDINEKVIEMQLKMATSSINHEYARMEFDDTDDRERREELLDFMHDCRCQYFEARQALTVHDPYAVEDFEADLVRQKQSAIVPHHI